MSRVFNNIWFAVFVPAFIGLGCCALSVTGFELYGYSLFLGLPVLVSFLSAFFWNFRNPKGYWKSYGIACQSIAALGGLILIFALDGLICLLMALPLALALALLGAWLGWLLSSGSGRRGGKLSVILFLSFPFCVAFENSQPKPERIRQVTTTVEIEADIHEVWETVVAFPKIEEPPTAMFQMGIAYPIEARIEGTGVGAIRYCVFSTGDFVEPITVWDEPNLLAFDVTKSPCPMKELSIHQHVHAPHLHDHLVSKNGQFKLTQRDGKVVLEGTTWYTHTIDPDRYWGVISDYIIHKIHLRVLNHIKEVAENS
ncbi:MAG: hypothetical protein AAF226_07985 [Verrucomicrobiota bacterium]